MSMSRFNQSVANKTFCLFIMVFQSEVAYPYVVKMILFARSFLCATESARMRRAAK